MQDYRLAAQATLMMYTDCIKDATSGIIKNWIVLLASVLMFYIFILSSQIFAGIGMVGGFILGLISALFTAQYYSWLSATVQKDKMSIKDLYQFDAGMFFSVIGISFILYIVYAVISPMSRSAENAPLIYLIYFFIVFAFNALPEVTYIHRYESLNAFSEALKFTKENWIEWYVPFILLLLPVFLLLYEPLGILLRFALVSPLFPGIIILSTWSAFLESNPYIGMLIGFFMSHWYMLFRGCLYKELSTGTRRRRMYLAKQK